jgi:hypothetical protein
MSERRRNTQKILTCISLTRRAHSTQGMWQGHTYQPAEQRRWSGAHLGVRRPPRSAEPGWAPIQVHFGGISSTAIPTSVPTVSLYASTSNRTIQAIKGGEETLPKNNTFGEEEKRDSTLLCSIRIGVCEEKLKKSRTCRPLFYLVPCQVRIFWVIT